MTHSWHQLMINWVNSNMNNDNKPFLPEPYNWKTYGDMNVGFFEKHQSTSLDSAKDSFVQSHSEVMKLAEEFSNEELFTKNAYKWVGGSTMGSYFVSVTASHYDWAMKKMKELKNAALKQYPDQGEKIITRAFEMNQQLCQENSNQSQKVLMHTRDRIYPSISFYKSVLEITKSKEEAYHFIADYFSYQAKSANKSLRILCKLPFVYKIVPLITKKLIHNVFGIKSGFEMIDYPKEKGRCHIDMTLCPYFSACKEYECCDFILEIQERTDK